MSIWSGNPKHKIPRTYEKRPKIGIHIGFPAHARLDRACSFLGDCWGHGRCYMVGSVHHKPDFRDVDIVFIMDDETFDHHFGKGMSESGSFHLNPRWNFLCELISDHLTKELATGKQVDFKFQPMKWANSDKNRGPRQPLGLSLNVDENKWRCYKCKHDKHVEMSYEEREKIRETGEATPEQLKFLAHDGHICAKCGAEQA